MAVPARLELLRKLRGDLADNLTAMGVAASDTETLETLVPKVLRLLEGTGESFSATLKPAWDVSYGVFSTGETACFAGMAVISKAVRVTGLTVTVTGEGVSALTAAGTGWTSSRSGDTLTAVYRPGGVVTSRALSDALEGLSLTGDDVTSVTASVSLSGLGASGQAYPASGTAQLIYAYNMTWDLLQTFYPTWAALDGKTWVEATAFAK